MGPKAQAAQPLTNAQIKAILTALVKDDRIEVTWRESETDECDAGETMTWTGTVVVPARLEVNEPPEGTLRADILWVTAAAPYQGKATRLPEDGMEYFRIEKKKKAARGRLREVQMAAQPNGEPQQQVQPQVQGQANAAAENELPGLPETTVTKLRNGGITSWLQIGEMSDADYGALGIPLGDKLKIKAIFKATGTANDDFRAVAAGII